MQVETTDLVDSHGVAELIGLTSRGAVAVYRKRYPDFPRPVVDMGAGRCLLWLRADVEAWAAGRKDAPRPPEEPGGTHGGQSRSMQNLRGRG